jgi:hypothetical protein
MAVRPSADGFARLHHTQRGGCSGSAFEGTERHRQRHHDHDRAGYGDSQKNGFTEAEEKLQINFREDLAANLGGDFLLSLDGPVLPTPSWKAVIEVNDSDRLEQTLERLTEAIRKQADANPAHSITIEPSDAGGQRYYSVQDTVTGNVVAQYTYANGYMIVAPSRALLIQALQTYSTGNSLANSTAFKALLPKDTNENYSAVAYQNLSPVLTPLLAQLSGDTADAVRKLAADARPTAICARGGTKPHRSRQRQPSFWL